MQPQCSCAATGEQASGERPAESPAYRWPLFGRVMRMAAAAALLAAPQLGVGGGGRSRSARGATALTTTTTATSTRPGLGSMGRKDDRRTGWYQGQLCSPGTPGPSIPPRGRACVYEQSPRERPPTGERTEGGGERMGIIGWIILGLLAGAIAKLLLPGDDPGGFIVTTLLGVAGAIVGGLIASALDIGDLDEFFDIGTWLIAIGGSLLLLIVYRLFTGRGVSGGRATRY